MLALAEPKAFKCDHCAHCDNALTTSGAGALALWRDLNGVSVFTGIVKLPGELPGCPELRRMFGEHEGYPVFMRLDDPHGCIDGPGHIMSVSEFLSQLALYDGSEDNRLQQPVDAWRRPCKHIVPQDAPFFNAHFDKPTYEVIDLFPFSSTDGKIVTDLREDDDVVISVCGTTTDPDDPTKTIPFFERFWADVLSVTPCGLVTATPRSTLQWVDVSPSRPILFHADAVLARHKGHHWAAEEDDEEEEEAEEQEA